jgi:hypothetical protein
MGWRDEYLPDHAKRVKDDDAVQAARLPWCEFCPSNAVKPEQIHVHHAKSRGAGGGDVAGNLISLCWLCHHKAHTARISRPRIMRFLINRDGLWRLLGGKRNCRCGCKRFRYIEETGSFECMNERCRSVYAP